MPAGAAAAATARARRSRRLSGLSEIDSAPPEVEVEVEAGAKADDVAQGTWGPDAVKVAVFGDMGTAEVDGSVREGKLVCVYLCSR